MSAPSLNEVIQMTALIRRARGQYVPPDLSRIVADAIEQQERGAFDEPLIAYIEKQFQPPEQRDN